MCCVSVFLLLGQDCWLEEWDRAVRWGVWLCPSVHSAGSCAFFSVSSAASQLVTKHCPGRIHIALSENEGRSMTGQGSLEECRTFRMFRMEY